MVATSASNNVRLKSRQWSCSALVDAHNKTLAAKNELPDEGADDIDAQIKASLGLDVNHQLCSPGVEYSISPCSNPCSTSLQ